MIEGADDRLAAALGREGLERLRGSTVAVIGVGLLGGSVSHHLGLLEVRQVLIDPGRVEPPNLGNQGFPADALGRWKSDVRARQIAELSPGCRVEAIAARVEELGLARLAGSDLLVTGLDSRRSRAHVNDVSQRLGVPWVDMAVDGSGRESLGTVALYDPRAPDRACYLCRLDAAAFAALSREDRPAGCPSWRDTSSSITAPTLASSALGGVVAGWAALWCIDVLLGRGEALGGSELLVFGRPPGLRKASLRRSPRCVHDHGRLALRRAPGDTVGRLLAAAGSELGAAPDALVFHHRTLVYGLLCPACGARRELVRLSHAVRGCELRCSCGSEHEMVPDRLTERLSPAEASRIADARWADLGFPARDVVTAVSDERSVHYVVNVIEGEAPAEATAA